MINCVITNIMLNDDMSGYDIELKLFANIEKHVIFVLNPSFFLFCESWSPKKTHNMLFLILDT
jgi:hypothetical protein